MDDSVMSESMAGISFAGPQWNQGRAGRSRGIMMSPKYLPGLERASGCAGLGCRRAGAKRSRGTGAGCEIITGIVLRQ